MTQPATSLAAREIHALTEGAVCTLVRGDCATCDAIAGVLDAHLKAALELAEDIVPELLFQWRIRFRALDALLELEEIPGPARGRLLDVVAKCDLALAAWDPEIQAWLRRHPERRL